MAGYTRWTVSQKAQLDDQTRPLIALHRGVSTHGSAFGAVFDDAPPIRGLVAVPELHEAPSLWPQRILPVCPHSHLRSTTSGVQFRINLPLPTSTSEAITHTISTCRARRVNVLTLRRYTLVPTYTFWLVRLVHNHRPGFKAFPIYMSCHFRSIAKPPLCDNQNPSPIAEH
jgi:hypothetical protein